MTRFSILSIVLLTLGLLGCASTPPEATDLRQPVTPRTAVIHEAVSWVVSGKSVHGLLPGVYTAEKENALGTFFKGKGEALFMGQEGTYYILQEGGFWMPRAPDALPRLYFTLIPDKTFIGDKLTKVKELPTSAPQAPPPSADVAPDVVTPIVLRSGVAPEAAGLAGAISTGILGAIIESSRGDPLLLPPITDANLARQLRAALLQ